jgi:thiamine-phosphate pyrophosphorylase
MSLKLVHQLSPVYLITDRKIANPDLFDALESALKGGVRMIQLREKDLSTAELRKVAEKTLKLTRFYGAKLLLNGMPELAAEIGADGVQLGVNSCQIATARNILGDRALIGYSAHSTHEVEYAAEQGADFVTFSPIYYTASKAQYGPPQGLQALTDICQNASIPVYALGGINTERTSEVLNAGACGVALISAVFGATDVQKSVQDLLQKISVCTSSG